MSKPWTDFKVGAPSTRPGWTAPDCQPLTSVAHVAHVPAALRIAEDAKLRTDLVFDKSKLNTERIRVVWLSSNYWNDGFRYGSVRFSFDWTRLVKGKKSYWVESIAYRIPACRILLTEADRSKSLEPYDPKEGDGPWWLAPTGEHYWNGQHTLEIMVEDDLHLAEATGVDFVKHHKKFCNGENHACRYLGFARDAGGAEFLAALVSRRPSLELPGLDQDSLQSATKLLRIRCSKAGAACAGSVTRTEPSAPALARAALGALGNPGLISDLARVAAHFRSVDDLEGAVVDAIAAAVGLPAASLLI